MRLLIMARSQHVGGVNVYTNNMIRELAALDTNQEIILLCQTQQQVIAFKDTPKIKVIHSEIPTNLLWDQSASWVARRYGCNLVFNLKYSIPLTNFSRKMRRAFVCHGLDWYVLRWGQRWIDKISHDVLFRMYVQAADGIIAVSRTVRAELINRFRKPDNQVRAVYHGIDDLFRAPITDAKKAEAKAIFNLPAHYFLYVGQIYPAKNFKRLLHAYGQVGPRLGIHLVVAGEHRWLAERDINLIHQLGLDHHVHQIGWVSQDNLPVLYHKAEALVLPSLYEGFGIPIIEAMACGCPVITGGSYSMPEIAGGAALLVDPSDTESIAAGMEQMLTDTVLRQRLIQLGNVRQHEFTWKRCAIDTMRFLEEVACSKD